MQDFEIAMTLTRLAQQAMGYNLREDDERKRSVANLAQLFFALQRVSPPALFVEAGAHNAATSRRIRSMLPDIPVLAFEANPHNHARFTSQHNYTALRIDYRLQALSDKNGDVTFRVLVGEGNRPHAHVSGRSSLLARTDPTAQYETVTVPAVTLSGAVAPHPGDVSLWVDVEGAAAPVLTGAKDILPRTSTMMIEVETRPFWDGQWLVTDVMRALMAHGLVPVARDFQAQAQFNLLFVRADLMSHPGVLRVLDGFFSQILHPAVT